MSDYHVLDTDLKLKTVKVVFHIPIPPTNNAVGVSWQGALVLSLGGADKINSALPDITIDEEIDMDEGSIFEIVENVRFSSLDLTNTQRLAEVETAYTIIKTKILADMQIILNFCGKDGDVV